MLELGVVTFGHTLLKLSIDWKNTCISWCLVFDVGMPTNFVKWFSLQVRSGTEFLKMKCEFDCINPSPALFSSWIVCADVCVRVRACVRMQTEKVCNENNYSKTVNFIACACGAWLLITITDGIPISPEMSPWPHWP